MWPFDKAPTKERLQGVKSVTVYGIRFKIRRISPLLDFPSDRLPQIFALYAFGRRKMDLGQPSTDKLRDDIRLTLKAGIVEPEISENSSDGITVDDILRDQDVANALYLAILDHTLLRFRGLKSVFFWTGRLRLRFTLWLLSTDRGRAILLSGSEKRA